MCCSLRKWDAKSYLLLLIGSLRVSLCKHLHLQRKEVPGHVPNSLGKGRGSPRSSGCGALWRSSPKGVHGAPLDSQVGSGGCCCPRGKLALMDGVVCVPLVHSMELCTILASSGMEQPASERRGEKEPWSWEKEQRKAKANLGTLDELATRKSVHL